MAETSEGHQPLCAVWPVSALGKLTEALADGAHPATWLMLESIGAIRVRFPRPEAFTNVNTRADLAAIAGRLEQERGSSHRVASASTPAPKKRFIWFFGAVAPLMLARAYR